MALYVGRLFLLLAGSRKGEPGPGLLLAAVLFAAPALCLLPPGWQQLVWMINILGAPILAALVVIILFGSKKLPDAARDAPANSAIISSRMVTALCFTP